MSVFLSVLLSSGVVELAALPELLPELLPPELLDPDFLLSRKATWSKSVFGADAVTVLMTSFDACCTGLTGSLAVGGDRT